MVVTEIPTATVVQYIYETLCTVQYITIVFCDKPAKYRKPSAMKEKVA
ncbi:hypothetical protein HDF11_000691 [Tunturiibacter psychrotolerans]